MIKKPNPSVLIVVAHPDDEILWCGGTILSHPEWACFVVSVCRGGDVDRSRRFYEVLALLHVKGAMADLNDDPQQSPLNLDELKKTILSLVPDKPFDLILTHHPKGEYTRHLRHEEVSKAVVHLWNTEQISSPELWTFAFEDGTRAFYPGPMENADILVNLETQVWDQKYQLLTQTYGFGTESWEAMACPKSEAFFKYQKNPLPENHF